MSNNKSICYFNWKKDWSLIKKSLKQEECNLVKLEFNENLYHDLCQIITSQFAKMNQLTPVDNLPQELYEGYYRSAIYNLIYRWKIEQAGLLNVWAELGTQLARSQYFTNGNKRTSLLSMIAFIQACGFRLKDKSDKEVAMKKWEKLMIDLAAVDSEEFAIELAKERIFWELDHE